MRTALMGFQLYLSLNEHREEDRSKQPVILAALCAKTKLKGIPQFLWDNYRLIKGISSGFY